MKKKFNEINHVFINTNWEVRLEKLLDTSSVEVLAYKEEDEDFELSQSEDMLHVRAHIKSSTGLEKDYTLPVLIVKLPVNRVNLDLSLEGRGICWQQESPSGIVWLNEVDVAAGDDSKFLLSNIEGFTQVWLNGNAKGRITNIQTDKNISIQTHDDSGVFVSGKGKKLQAKALDNSEIESQLTAELYLIRGNYKI